MCLGARVRGKGRLSESGRPNTRRALAVDRWAVIVVRPPSMIIHCKCTWRQAGPNESQVASSFDRRPRALSWGVDRSRNARTFQPSPNTHEHYSASRVPCRRGGLRCTRRGRKREAEADQRASIEMTRWPCVCSGGRAPPGRVIRFESEVAESVGRVRIKPPTTTISPTTRGIKAKPQIEGKKKTYITWFGLSDVGLGARAAASPSPDLGMRRI